MECYPDIGDKWQHYKRIEDGSYSRPKHRTEAHLPDTDPITVTAHFLSIGLVTVRVKDDAVSTLHPCTAFASVQEDTDIADETLLTFLDETPSTSDV